MLDCRDIFITSSYHLHNFKRIKKYIILLKKNIKFNFRVNKKILTGKRQKCCFFNIYKVCFIRLKLTLKDVSWKYNHEFHNTACKKKKKKVNKYT